MVEPKSGRNSTRGAGDKTYAFVLDESGRASEVEHEPDAELLVTVHLGFVGQQLDCIGVDVRSFWEVNGDSEAPLFDQGRFSAINSVTWRSLPIGHLIERTIKWRVSEASRQASGGYDFLPGWDPAWNEQASKVIDSEPRRQRGPRSGFTPAILAGVVRPAYMAGGRKPVVAVQEALGRTGFPGAGPAGEVTIDQARKAVVKARSEGLIPPAMKHGKRR